MEVPADHYDAFHDNYILKITYKIPWLRENGENFDFLGIYGIFFAILSPELAPVITNSIVKSQGNSLKHSHRLCWMRREM